MRADTSLCCGTASTSSGISTLAADSSSENRTASPGGTITRLSQRTVNDAVRPPTELVLAKTSIWPGSTTKRPRLL
jgi:hypothetical protein